MYTRCPTCSTCFRVTDRHLAIAKGKVRCGQCQLVFNAPEHAIDDLPVDQLTPPVTPKPSSSTLDTNADIKKSPTSTRVKKAAPAPLAPTAKEKAEANTQAIKPEKIINLEPEVKKTSTSDFDATMIADVSALNNDEVESIHLGTPSRTAYGSTVENDDSLFDDSFDMNAAIDELTQSTEEIPGDLVYSKQKKITPKKSKQTSLPKDNDSDVFQTDAYDATSASSVTDILDEMEGQMSLDIKLPKRSKTNEKYDANNEFDFLELDDEPNNQLERDENDIKNTSFQKQHFDVEINNREHKDEYTNKEDELFDQTDLSDFEDSGVGEKIVLEKPDFENSEFQNIGQHVDEHNVPIQLRKDINHLQAGAQRRWHPLLAPIFIIFLLLLSFSQLAFFRSHELVQQIPSSRPMLEAFCEKLGCSYSGPRDIKQIQLLSRDVRLHPKEKNALLISAAMINNAYFSQPYPNIHIRLSDISGNIIAERIFNSKTYMGKLNNPFLLMKSKTPVHINFEVVDPGKDAINFEFTFL